jgi:hypothetical protein
MEVFFPHTHTDTPEVTRSSEGCVTAFEMIGVVRLKRNSGGIIINRHFHLGLSLHTMMMMMMMLTMENDGWAINKKISLIS